MVQIDPTAKPKVLVVGNSLIVLLNNIFGRLQLPHLAEQRLIDMLLVDGKVAVTRPVLDTVPRSLNNIVKVSLTVFVKSRRDRRHQN